jgi:hypothetical protein
MTLNKGARNVSPRDVSGSSVSPHLTSAKSTKRTSDERGAHTRL